MRNLSAWSVLAVVFLLAGEGFNLFRIHIESWLAYGHWQDGGVALLGLLLGFGGTAWLGGFIYYRDKKHNKITREGWRKQPLKRMGPPRRP